MTTMLEMDAVERIVVVTRETELDELIARFSTASQTRFYLEHAGASFDRIEEAHETYGDTLSSIRRAIPRDMKLQTIDRALVPRFDFHKHDIVVAIGPDGLVSNTAKYLTSQPLVGVNANPDLYDGVLLPFTAATFEAALPRLLGGAIPVRAVTMAQASTSDGQSLLAFNDFFIGARTHISARYEIAHAGRAENQSSSGIIVSTGAGSTGWMRSVRAGARGVAAALTGDADTALRDVTLAWDTDRLEFAVREPFPSRVTGTSIVFGEVDASAPLTVSSRMPGYGVIFSDGIEDDYVAFNSGSTVTVSLARRKAHLVAA